MNLNGILVSGTSILKERMTPPPHMHPFASCNKKYKIQLLPSSNSSKKKN